MSTLEQTCTAPERWPAPPRPEAPDAEVWAYLQHCDACPYHAAFERTRDLPLDVLLTEATRDLSLGPLPGVGRRRPARIIPMAIVSLAAAAVVAAALWIGGTPDAAQPALPPVAEHPAERVDPLAALFVGQRPGGEHRLMWYEARVISDERDGRYTGSGVRYAKDRLTAAAARLPFGTRLRIVNPVNGLAVVVTVIDRGVAEGRLHLSAAAADSLAFDGVAMMVAELLSTPASALGP